MQRGDGGASGRSPTTEFSPAEPFEMLVPTITTRLKYRGDLSGEGSLASPAAELVYFAAGATYVHHFDHVPDKSAWQGYQNDFDVRDLHKRFFGKSHEQVQEYFGEGSSISRMDELMFAPRPVFQYYVQSFAMFVLSPAAAGDSATASAFLSLLEARQDAGSVKEIYPLVAECVGKRKGDRHVHSV